MKNKKSNKTKKKKRRDFFKNALFAAIVLMLILNGIAIGFIYSTVKDLRAFNPYGILDELNLNSYILDESGNTIEKIHAEENRSIADLKDIPLDLQNAFIAIEDERFSSHKGIDFRSLLGAVLENLRSRSIERGASTITQQLARNVYLSHEVTIERKIREAYIAVKLEQALSKEQILEAYLNSIYFGQGAYGVEEASDFYFDKSPSELSLAESAVIAGITNNPSDLPPYLLIKPENVKAGDIVLSKKDVLGEPYIAVFNPKSLQRQKLILSKMKQKGYIDDSEYEKALLEDIESAVVVKDTANTDISSYFIDYVKDQAVKDLVKKAGYTEEAANRALYKGGIKVTSTVDLELQKSLEHIYENFDSEFYSGKLSSWNTDSSGNVVKSSKSSDVVYYKKSNLLDESGDLFLNSSEYELDSKGNLHIFSDKFSASGGRLYLKSYYSIDKNRNIVVHELGSLSIPNSGFTVEEDGEIVINSDFLNNSVDFFKIDSAKRISISSDFFSIDDTGVLQPQSAAVVIDQESGKIKALIGGRNWGGKRLLNRALLPRQTGSAMKPIGVYLPALDNNFTAASPIDDVPLFDSEGNVWPRNYDSRHRGLTTLRKSVELSINTNAVTVLESVGIQTSTKYLERMGIIKENETDTFTTRYENQSLNDENPAAIALGGLTKGVSPLDMAAAYASIANEGTYIRPRAYTKIEDKDGSILIDNTESKTKVVSKEISFLMTDILRTTVTDGLNVSRAARIDSSNSSIPVAGKTGTTNENSDVWFVGYTPYYTASVWIGNDSLSVKLTESSKIASSLFSSIMKTAHNGLPPKSFNRPENIVEKEICVLSGNLASPYCGSSNTKTEIFARGKEPVSVCDIH